MSKKTKNISFPTLVKETEMFSHLRGKPGIRTIEITPEWMPSPHDIQISLQHLGCDEHASVGGAFHQRFVLKIHLSGVSEGYVGKKLYRFEPGSGILVFPFQLHRINGIPEKSGQLRLLANFTLSKEDQALLEPLRNYPFKLTEKDCQFFLRMLRHTVRNTQNDRREAVFVLSSLLLNLLEKVRKKPPLTQEIPPSVKTIFDFIHQHYKDLPTVKEIARELHCSETGLRQMFLRETGQTPGRFMQELRLRDSAELLRYSRFPIQEISRKCGFSNPFSFSRAFRNKFRQSPKDFRGNPVKKD